MCASGARAASVWTHRTLAVDGQDGIARIETAAINDRGDVAVLALRTVDEASVTPQDSRLTLFRLEGDALVPVVLPGTVLPDGQGTLVLAVASSANGEAALAVDPTGRILFKAAVQGGSLAGAGVVHLFRLEGTTITHLGDTTAQGSPVQGDNFLQHMAADGRWLVVRTFAGSGPTFDRDYRLTDGTTTSAPLTQFTFDLESIVDCDTRYLDLVGLTEAGEMIGLEVVATATKAPGDPNCGSGGGRTDSSVVRFASGAAPVTVTTDFNVVTSEAGGSFNPPIFRAVANLRGDVAFLRSRTRNDLVRRTTAGEAVLYSSDIGLIPGEVFFENLHDLDEDGRVVWSGIDGSTNQNAIYAGPVPAIDRVFGEDDLVGTDVVGINFLHGVAHPEGALSDQRQLLIGFLVKGSSRRGLVLAGRAGTRWINPASGAWSTDTNWAGGKIPGNVDAAMFDQEASYDVTVGTRTVGRALVENGSVGFQSSDLTLTGPLLVGGDATLTLPDGTLKAGELTVGHLPPTDLAVEPTARLNASGGSLLLDVSGPVVVGNAGQGEMFVTQGKVNSGELRIGSGSDGTVTLGLDGAEWTSVGSIAVGHTHRGTLNIERGARISTDGIIAIGAGATPPDTGGGGGGGEPTRKTPGSAATTSATPFATGTPGGKVVIDSAGTAAIQNFNVIATALRVGDGLPGELEIRNGGAVGLPEGAESLTSAHAAAPTAPFDARILITGQGTTRETASFIFNLGGASLGQAPFSLTQVQVEDGGSFFCAEGMVLAAAADSAVDVVVRGVHANGTSSGLSVGTNPANSHSLHIGQRGQATLSIRDGAELHARHIFIGGKTGSRGTLFVGGRAGGKVATVIAEDPSGLGGIFVGGSFLTDGDEGVPGELILDDGEVRTQFFDVTPAGIVRGHGKLTFTGTLELGGTIDPAIGVTRPVATRPATGESRSFSLARSPIRAMAAAGSTSHLRPGTLVLEGNVVLSPTAHVVLDVTGSASGASDRIVVNGALTLGGTLELNFTNGYAPRAGDALDLITSTLVTGAFATTTITGLAPGFDFTLAPNGAGGVRLTAVNDAVATTAVGSRLANLSVRTPLAEGQNLIVGFVMAGGAKPVLVRAAGPGLARFVDGTHADPRITLFDGGGGEVDANDDWPDSLAPIMQSLGAFSFASASADAALERSTNASYTAHVNGPGSGIVLVELYDAQEGVAPRLVNVSARNHVGTGAAVLIAGFVVEGTSPKTLLVRGVGPGLLQHGVSGVLLDPRLAIFDAAGVQLEQNDDWPVALASTSVGVGAFPLTTGSKDAALLVTLVPGVYTAQVSGVDGTTGEALVEIYEAP